MTDIILKIYDYIHRHTLLGIALFFVATTLLIGLVCRIQFKEDISAFLPLSEEYKESLQVYQNVSGSSKLIAIFQQKDTSETDVDNLISSMRDFEKYLSETDTAAIIKEKTAQVDYDKIRESVHFVYDNIPLFLTESDYVRMDSLLSILEYTENQLQEDLQILMFPTSVFFTENLEKDPLNLFTPIVSELNNNKETGSFELYDGYIFTKDAKRGLIVLTSPYGNSETQHNAQLMQMLTSVADSVTARHPSVSVHFTGGPAIAVGNSHQMRQDTLLSITIAVLLIMALLYYAFRSVRNILLVALSISWGWLFALGLLSVFRENISLIVLGISSIIVGIAVNYPLHLIAHASHTRDVRQALREIISPLVIGNITTVGAFCALIPLQATALRDLGIFSALLLMGTILFVVIWLPHIIKIKAEEGEPCTPLLDWIANLPIEKNRCGIGLIGILTLFFGWFSLGTQFDADMNQINYMTAEQRANMEYLGQMTTGTDHGHQCIYVVSRGRNMEEALRHSQQTEDKLKGRITARMESCSRFLCSKEEQARRIQRWERFVQEHSHLFHQQLIQEALSAGFSSDAFVPFLEITSRRYQPQDYAYFQPLQPLYASHVSTDLPTGKYRIIDTVIAEKAVADSVRNAIAALLPPTAFCFDIESMNRELTAGLTTDFDYVGWACAAIVFLFLWFSFRSISLAMLTFLPMVVSWIWILGIMALLGIQFNLVNVILATFIFGQGDDYTIFMTEGCLYERRHGRKMLTAHKRSIILSALIMFVGIGSLIFAKHPALHSLAEVTIVGMFSVVLMALVIPPLFLKTPWPPNIEKRPKQNNLSTR